MLALAKVEVLMLFKEQQTLMEELLMLIVLLRPAIQ